jgi:hypothetical protein
MEKCFHGPYADSKLDNTLHYAFPLVFTLDLNTHARVHPVIQKNSPGMRLVMHAKQLSLNVINLAINTWEKSLGNVSRCVHQYIRFYVSPNTSIK